MIRKIRKRDGKVIDFNPIKITNAIWKAAQAVGGEDRNRAEELGVEIVKILEKMNHGKIPSVEGVQDIVEKVLVEKGHAKTAKAYILYRQKHTEARTTRNTFLDVQETISGYLDKLDWRVKENSNEQFSFSGLLLYTAGRVMANYNLNQNKLAKEISIIEKKIDPEKRNVILKNVSDYEKTNEVINQLQKINDELIKKNTVFAPVENNETIVFGQIKKPNEAKLDYKTLNIHLRL